MSEPICECGHLESQHFNGVCEHPGFGDMPECRCDEFKAMSERTKKARKPDARDAEIQALRDQLADARKDSERLEWMAHNHGKLCYYEVKRKWWVEYLNPDLSEEEETLTGPDVQHDFREAIDAAIEAAGKGSER